MDRISYVGINPLTRVAEKACSSNIQAEVLEYELEGLDVIQVSAGEATKLLGTVVPQLD